MTIEALAGVTSALVSTVTLARFVYSLKNTPADVKACFDLVFRVNEDVQYLIFLREKHSKTLSKSPTELKRLDGIVASASESVLDVGRLLERCRQDANGGRVPWKGRLRFVLGDSAAFSSRTPNLQQQHLVILFQIGNLRQLEALEPLKELAASTIFENADLLSMGGTKRAFPYSSSDGLGMQAQLESPPAYSTTCLEQSTFTERNIFDDMSSQNAQPVLDREGFAQIPDIGNWQYRHDLPQTPARIPSEEDDFEAAFFRDQRIQEEERRQRRESRTQNREHGGLVESLHRE